MYFLQSLLYSYSFTLYISPHYSFHFPSECVLSLSTLLPSQFLLTFYFPFTPPSIISFSPFPSSPSFSPLSTIPLLINTNTPSIFEPRHDMPTSARIFLFFLYRPSASAAFHSLDDLSSLELPHSCSNGSDGHL